MKKEVLIFGSGKQASKYIQYFSQNMFRIDIVNYHGKNSNHFDVTNIYTFSAWCASPSVQQKDYHIIVVCVKPYDQQEKVIKYLINYNNINSKIIIEKPISYDLNTLQILEKMHNVYYFLDELYLTCNFELILDKASDIDIIVYSQGSGKSHILEHALGHILRSQFFEISNINTVFKKDTSIGNTLKYDLYIDKKYCIHCNKGNIYLNTLLVDTLNFNVILSKVQSISDEKNLFYKQRFTLARQYLSQ